MRSIREAPMSIVGVPLTDAQSQTIRVALETFATSLRETGCGDDEVGKRICRDYLARIDEIRALIFSPGGAR